MRSELCSAISADTHAFLESARLEVIQLLQGMAEKGKKEKHEEQAHDPPQYSAIVARAKRERVVQDEVKKANRRVTDPTRPTRHPKRLSVKLTRSAQKAKCECASKVRNLVEN